MVYFPLKIKVIRRVFHFCLWHDLLFVPATNRILRSNEYDHLAKYEMSYLGYIELRRALT